MKLYHKQFGQGKPFVILHGLFGSSDNWQTHAKKFAEYYQVTLVDLRNHGHSPWSAEFSYALMVQDLHELFSELQLEKPIVLGHSMGGKLAMHFDHAFPGFIEKLIVVDMGVKAYPPHHAHILAAIHAIDLSKLGARSGVRQFLLKNLYWEEKGKLAWRVNFPVLEASMAEILRELPEQESFTPVLFMRGLLSNYILDEDISILESYYPDFQLASISNAGHWVHAEAPEPFLDSVLSFSLR
jgi:pimeloyl-ACP methyl ester carboxylesterase